MAAFAGFYTLAGLALIVLAFIPKSPLRRWLKSRHKPGVAGGTLTVAWLLGLIVMLIFVPATPAPKNTASTRGDAATTAEATSTRAAPTTQRQAATQHNTPAARAPEGVPADVQKATVDRIIDGDTLELSAVAAGAVLSSIQQVDVRLLEINTPETKNPSEPVQCHGAEATNRLAQLAPEGSTVWVQRDEHLRDQYGRYLLYLWNEQGEFVNLAMVKDGFAQAKLYQPNDLHWNVISAAEPDARAAGYGVWGACSYFGAPENASEVSPVDEGTYVPAPNANPDPDRPRSGGNSGCNPLTARDGDGDGVVCER